MQQFNPPPTQLRVDLEFPKHYQGNPGGPQNLSSSRSSGPCIEPLAVLSVVAQDPLGTSKEQLNKRNKAQFMKYNEPGLVPKWVVTTVLRERAES